jgi:hypothetical protein
MYKEKFGGTERQRQRVSHRFRRKGDKRITEVFDQLPGGWLAEGSCACVFSCLTGCLYDCLHDVNIADFEGRCLGGKVHYKGC